MVLFANAVIGQYVEVKHNSRIVCGTIRYKGHLNGVKGDWIGVELEYPLGNHNGCWRGRQYFKCRSDCGIFTHASNIRFRRQSRRSHDSYRRVNLNSSFDENLFMSSYDDQCDCYSISPSYARNAKSAFASIETENAPLFQKPKQYHLQHSIGRYIPAATMLEPKFSQITYEGVPVYCQNDYQENEFSSVPTIPHYTMPHEALKRQVKRGGWEKFGLTQPRFMSM